MQKLSVWVASECVLIWKKEPPKYVLGCHWVKQVGESGEVSNVLFTLPHGALRGGVGGCGDSEHITLIQEAEKRAEHQAEPWLAEGKVQPEMSSSLGPAAPAIFGVSLLQAKPLQDSPEGTPGNLHSLPLLQMTASGFSLWGHLCLHLGLG